MVSDQVSGARVGLTTANENLDFNPTDWIGSNG